MKSDENRAKQRRTKRPHFNSMQVALFIPQNLAFLFIIFSTFFSPSLAGPRPSETLLICDNSKPPSGTNLIPNFVKAMEAISGNVSDQNWGIYSITSPPPPIYGFAQCHSDLTPTECKLCFEETRSRLPKCLPAHSARIYLDGCFLRVDNYNFFDEVLDPKFDQVNCSSQPGVLKDRSLYMDFNTKVGEAISNVTEKAVKNEGFGASEVGGGVVTVYALAQCWMTVDKEDCKLCLVKAGQKLRKCAPGSEGRAMYAGCYMRYSAERFFTNEAESGSHAQQASCSAIKLAAAVALSAIILAMLAFLAAFMAFKMLSKRKEERHKLHPLRGSKSSLHFEYEVLEKATDSFNESRKLGQGGAGSVFKGNLPDGRTVAVKRLVFSTRQWVDEFFNEVNLISGIQHKNLVGLLGCSIEGPESLLVYEYVPNRSLDQILFVKSTVHILSWQQRLIIISGIAEGLAYLHGGSGVRIIHRDIKTSNILLDEEFTPKIADFGLARCVAAGKSHISTGVAGTLGYLAPEYLIRGQLTEKADVYAFGVLVLEVATGRKNSVFSHGSSSILHTVWKHHKANTITQSVEAALSGRYPEKQASNVLQIGLLCTQAAAGLRPSMAEVVKMLNDEECFIPSPKQPPFLNASVLSPDDGTENSLTKYSFLDVRTKPAVPSDDSPRSYFTAESPGSSRPSTSEPVFQR